MCDPACTRVRPHYPHPCTHVSTIGSVDGVGPGRVSRGALWGVGTVAGTRAESYSGLGAGVETGEWTESPHR